MNGPPPPPDELESRAFRAIWMGIGGLILGMIGPFTCYLGNLIGAVLGGLGAYNGWQVSQEAGDEPEHRTVSRIATAGMTASIVAFLYSGLLVLFLGFIAVMYALMLVFAIVGAAVTN